MFRGPLHQADYVPKFSGHETFPMRYGWLKKAYDAVARAELTGENSNVFQKERAISYFGVGKNMVTAIRHWALQANVIKNIREEKRIVTTPLGQKIFGENGLDPYMEEPATLWLIHWKLAGSPHKTTWFWVFNHFPNFTFERDQLVNGLVKLATDRGWSRFTQATIKRDVECFIRTYVAHEVGRNIAHEDTLESPLTELGLIKPIGRKDGFRLVRGAQSSLGDGIFVYALINFWTWFSSAQTLSFEAIAHHPGSPGQVFQLDEDELANRLSRIEEITEGGLSWSETAGLKQVIRSVELNNELSFSYIYRDYKRQRKVINAIS